jgi:2-methylcitrate dehydratase PrpD
MIEERIAEAAVSAATVTHPPAAIAAAKQCILDWIGCTIAGSRTAPVAALVECFREELGTGACSIFAAPGRGAPGTAALINGTAAHAVELDDIYSPALFHPGAPIIAAALAAVQAARGSGDTLIRAVILGYEIANRIGTRVNPKHYEYWHTTGTVGTIGAALAASLALGLTRQQVAWAIGHAATMASGLQQAFRSDGMTKPLHAGRAAEGGLLAARAARAGLTGSGAMLSGDVGFGRAMSDAPDWSDALDGLFADYTIARTTFKRFSCCGHIFAAADAALALRAQGVDARQVARIEIATYRKAIDVAGIARPATPFEARFSIAFGVAAALVGHDLADPETFASGLADPRVQALIGRVTCAVDPKIDAAFPRLRGAHVTAVREGGARDAVLVPTRKGEPGNPLTAAELRAKFFRMIAGTAFEQSGDGIAAWVERLDSDEAIPAFAGGIGAAA